jgi:hypothetical protein
MQKKESLGAVLLTALIAVPMLGFGMGGIYSFPALKLTKGRQPWFALLLTAGLAVTVLAIGLPGHLSWLLLGGIWAAAVLVLLLAAPRLFGPLDQSLEPFGFVHLFTILAVLGTVVFHQAAERRAAALHARAAAAQIVQPASPAK